jgi:hypothetical protein
MAVFVLDRNGKTKFNRSPLNIAKSHALDASRVVEVNAIQDWNKPKLNIKSMGRGCYQRRHLTAFGFPRGYLTRAKNIQGFQTGDMVQATFTKENKIGIYTGLLAVRATGNFNIQSATEVIQGISHRYCQIVQRADGYGYSQTGAISRNSRGQVGSKARIAWQSALTSPALSPLFHA